MIWISASSDAPTIAASIPARCRSLDGCVIVRARDHRARDAVAPTCAPPAARLLRSAAASLVIALPARAGLDGALGRADRGVLHRATPSRRAAASRGRRRGTGVDRRMQPL